MMWTPFHMNIRTLYKLSNFFSLNVLCLIAYICSPRCRFRRHLSDDKILQDLVVYVGAEQLKETKARMRRWCERAQRNKMTMRHHQCSEAIHPLTSVYVRVSMVGVEEQQSLTVIVSHNVVSAHSYYNTITAIRFTARKKRDDGILTRIGDKPWVYKIVVL